MNFEANKNIKILIVDDNENYSQLLSYSLKKNNFKVDIATSTMDTINKVKKSDFHIAIVDVILGEESGIELIQQLKEIDKDMIFIISTGQASVTEKIELANLEIAAHLIKPFKMEILLQTINDALIKRQK